MKNQIYFTLLFLAISAVMAFMTGCANTPPISGYEHELVIKNNSSQKIIKSFEDRSECLAAGITFPKPWHSFECRKERVDCAFKYLYFDEVIACLKLQNTGWF